MNPWRKCICNLNLPKHNPEICQQKLLKLSDIILSQNYFQSNQNNYRQTNGLAMGAPTSVLLPDFFKFLEYNQYLKSSVDTKSSDVLDTWMIF